MNIEGLSLAPVPEGWYQIRELRSFRKRKKGIKNFSSRRTRRSRKIPKMKCRLRDQGDIVFHIGIKTKKAVDFSTAFLILFRKSINFVSIKSVRALILRCLILYCSSGCKKNLYEKKIFFEKFFFETLSKPFDWRLMGSCCGCFKNNC